MAFYRLTRNSVSVIRQDAAGVATAEACGYVLDGVCDADGNLTGEPVDFSTEQPPKPIADLAEKKSKGRR